MVKIYKTLIIILIISVILTLSGCTSKPKGDKIYIGNATEKNITQSVKNNMTQIQDLINNLTSNKSPTYQDDKFVKIVEEANDIIDNNNEQIMTAAKNGNFEDIEKYGKNLETNSTKYMLILERMNVSSRFTKMYSEYYNYLENVNKTGKHIQESAKQHKLMNSGYCSDPSFDIQM